MSLDALIKIKGMKRYKIPLPKKELQMVEDTDNEMKMMMIMMMNFKNQVQCRIRTQSSIVHVMYTLLYIYDV